LKFRIIISTRLGSRSGASERSIAEGGSHEDPPFIGKLAQGFRGFTAVSAGHCESPVRVGTARSFGLELAPFFSYRQKITPFVQCTGGLNALSRLHASWSCRGCGCLGYSEAALASVFSSPSHKNIPPMDGYFLIAKV
jgi:hypothetical protein